MKNKSEIVTRTALPERLQLEVLRRKIRSASEPDNPNLLSRLFTLAANQGCQSRLDARFRWITQYWLLLETIEDASLPSCWREHCLNVIHFPLRKLNELADGGQSQRYVKSLELRVKRLAEIYS